MNERYAVLPPETPGVALHSVPNYPGFVPWKAPPIAPPSALDPRRVFRMRPQLAAASSVTVPTVPPRALDTTTGNATSSRSNVPRAMGT